MIMENADEVLPLASNHGGKLFHVVRSSFVDSLEACLKSYHSRLIQVPVIRNYLLMSLKINSDNKIKRDG